MFVLEMMLTFLLTYSFTCFGSLLLLLMRFYECLKCLMLTNKLIDLVGDKLVIKVSGKTWWLWQLAIINWNNITVWIELRSYYFPFDIIFNYTNIFLYYCHNMRSVVNDNVTVTNAVSKICCMAPTELSWIPYTHKKGLKTVATAITVALFIFHRIKYHRQSHYSYGVVY